MPGTPGDRDIRLTISASEGEPVSVTSVIATAFSVTGQFEFYES